MRSSALSLALVLGTVGFVVPTLRGNDNEARLREQLRATAVQLRNSESERAALQAAKAADEEKLRQLTEQNAALQKRLSADKESADKAQAAAQSALVERDAQLREIREALIKRESEFKKLQAEAIVLEAKRALAAGKVITLDRRVADLTQRNRTMFNLGMEVLSRYEKFGLGDALMAREPFVGLTRVKFENLIQDYSDKLTDARVKP
ncbi:MAG: phage major capsid protein [Verrucomicrobia bacterium]|nr:phage major capsid protein [Verrucomicrobiota bacterium]